MPWGEAMGFLNIRGLFEAVFGKRPTSGSSLPAFRLLSSYDSSFTPFNGRAWDIGTVRAAVDAWARNAAKIQPRHIRRAGGRRETVHNSLERLLQIRPNPYMTAYAFYYRVAAQFIVYNNAFILPVFDGGKLTALYPINASRVDLVEDMGGMYARLTFATGNVYTVPYEHLVHLRRHYLDNDIFGDDNRPLLPALETADAFNKSMSKFARLVSVIRGILEALTVTKQEDLAARRDAFVRDNFSIEANGSGVIITDGKHKYTPIQQKETPIPTGQLEFVRREIYDYFGMNEAIVQNKATPEEMDAFYRGQLVPFYMQLAQGLTNAIFTEREQSFGNEVLCEMDRIQFETLDKRVEAAQFLTNIGALELDQVLEVFGFPPIGGEEGKRRVQTLNMVNAAIADKYQLESNGTKTEADPPPQKPQEPPSQAQQDPQEGEEGQEPADPKDGKEGA